MKNNVVDIKFSRAFRDRKKEVTSRLRADRDGVANLVTLYQNDPRYDVESLVEALGIGLVYEELPGDILGQLRPAKNATPSGREIAIRSGLPEATQRWVIMHEWAHWYADHGGISGEKLIGSDSIENYEPGSATAVNLPTIPALFHEDERISEKVANWLASFALVPERALKKLIEEHNLSNNRGSVVFVADHFCVPDAVAYIRLKDSCRRLKRSES